MQQYFVAILTKLTDAVTMKISNMFHTILPSLIAGILLALVTQAASAETPDVTAAGDTITAKHRYTMGDNDSKSDATTICFLEAKRKAIEYAGVYVESTVEISQTEKSRKAQSDMKTIAAALVSAEMVSSNTGFDNGKVFVDCVVNAKVDKSQLKQEIAKINSDPAAKKQIEQQQIMLKKLEAEIMKIQNRIESASSQQAISLRQERTAVFKNIDKLQQKKMDIVSYIENKGKDAEELITVGMTERDVITLIGKNRASNWSIEQNELNNGRTDTWKVVGWNYGSHWVHFRDGVVICVSAYSQYSHGCK